MTRNELADAINQSPTGRARHLVCDEERIRRWETGEVQWPSTDYRKALQEATGRDPHELGFRPRPATHGRTTQPVTSGTLRVELESRRHLLRQSISELQQELTFLDVILAVPDLGELLSR
jgi:hypothetical protein